jgi:hypothetical protein
VTELSDDTILYRAISRKDWIDPDTKEIDSKAFIRVFKKTIDDIEENLSAALTSEDSYNGLNKCFGVIRFKVADLRDLGLDAIQDEPDHVSIINVPHPEKEEKKAIDISGKLASKAELYLDRLNDPIKRNRDRLS